MRALLSSVLALHACLSEAREKSVRIPIDNRSPCKPEMFFGPGYDLYEGFDMKKWDLDKQTNGWSNPEVDRIYDQVVHNATRGVAHPMIVEVGVWKGRSSLMMATSLKTRWYMKQAFDAGASRQSHGHVWSVDTFAGSMEFWKLQGKSGRGHKWEPGKKTDRDLRLLHGKPTIYYQFVANIIRDDLKEYVVPMPIDGGTAAVWFEQNCPYIDVVHLDAAHEYENVLADIRKYWKLLRPGGILLGDDYSRNWPGVVRAANEFAASTGLTLHHSNPAARRAAEARTLAQGTYKWWVRKPKPDEINRTLATGAVHGANISVSAQRRASVTKAISGLLGRYGFG